MKVDKKKTHNLQVTEETCSLPKHVRPKPDKSFRGFRYQIGRISQNKFVPDNLLDFPVHCKVLKAFAVNCYETYKNKPSGKLIH